jgi:hypothetical protein
LLAKTWKNLRSCSNLMKTTSALMPHLPHLAGVVVVAAVELLLRSLILLEEDPLAAAVLL